MPAQKPVVSHAELSRLRNLIKLYSFDGEQMEKIARSSKELHHVTYARAKGQDEFMIAVLPESPGDQTFAVDVLHRLRGKPPASPDKLIGLAEKGYMRIEEPDVMEAMKKNLRDCFPENGQAPTR